MEIVLQWLDDLDDLVWVGLMKWESLRRRSLQAGFCSALLLASCNLNASAVDWVPWLAAIAASSVGLWSVTAAGSMLAKRRSISFRA